MTVISIAAILQGQVIPSNTVTIRGWVRTRRNSKSGISFITVYDGSCFHSIQVVATHEQSDVLRITTGCSVVITGQVVKSPGKGQIFEMQATNIEIIGWVEDPDSYPISAKNHSLEYLREVAHLRPRTNIIGAVARVRHSLAQALHRFFHDQGFFWVATPLITASNTEGAGDMFRVSTLDMERLPRTETGSVNYDADFFGTEAFLTVSGQLNGEAYASAISKIYTFGPIFRAEKSHTSRHLAEFWMLEPEIAFSSLEDIANLAEIMLKYVFQVVLLERADDMAFFEERINKDVITRLQHCITNPFTTISYDDAINILISSKQNFSHQIQWGLDLASEHERYLTEKYFKVPVVIKNYPKDLKAFYMRLNEDGKTVAAMDILAPGIGEIIGGSQREERLHILDMRLVEMGISITDYWWYRDLRRYGTVPHSGFGLGFERLVSYVTGVKNIRDVIAFPRTTRNVSF
ncbi:asparagine--tRNA ligase [Candidatus Erwinia haradaeae]|uniref:Asparagine--tRNA ligase n=1 Tax=Candidatus Erwinia haradaeae TaxID=1922217 RepID=A0A451D9B3_9GAMM|nr:asparagine--tRNA ligase [Candidatus Erwinia haradaeae]VFP82851.1 Asparagine--tRNA ligase [Candidatus Erwinia haradaeae]